MTVATLALSAGFALASGALFAFVGRTIARRAPAGDSRLAVRMFALWWCALASLATMTPIMLALALADLLTVPIYQAIVDVAVIAVFVALAGLMYYLLYLFTGNTRLLPIVCSFYALFYWVFMVYLHTLEPTGIAVKTWAIELDYATEPRGAFLKVLGLLLIVPHVLAAGAYFSLYFRVRDPVARYRIALVALTIVVWFMSSVFASIFEVSDTTAWQLSAKVLGLLAACTILAAYRPPSWIQRRLDAAQRATAGAAS